jgi:outer membrane protein assembly factor BamA
MKRFLLLVAFLCLAPPAGRAQEMYSEFEITKLTFAGNAVLKTDELTSVVRTKESPSWVWKFLYNVSESVGKKPEYFDPSLFWSDALRLRKYYQSNGFFKATVDTSVLLDRENKTASLTFRIKEGHQSRIDTLHYFGFENLPHELLTDINDNKLINVGDPYGEKKLMDEQRRIVTAFANYGFVQIHADPPTAVEYASTNNVTVTFAFVPGPRYKFGKVVVHSDSAAKEQVDPDVVLRFLDFKQGDYFNLSAKTQSEINLNRLGVFESAQIQEAVTDTNRKSLDIPMDVFVRPRPFYELSPEIGVNDERGYPNVSFGLGYVDRSFFGGARNLSSRVRLNVHSFQDLNLVRAFQRVGLRDSTILTNTDLTINFVQPYFIDNRTSLTSTILAALEKQKTYYSPIFRFRIGATAQTATYTRAFLDWNLEAIHPQQTGTGQDTSFGTGQNELKPQFNSIISFTLQRDKRNDIFSPSSGFFHSISVEEAGVFPSLFNRLLGISLPYAKYFKATALGQWYWAPDESGPFVLASKLHAGAAWLYGNSQADVPLTRKFYAGGSNSIRGWGARELGEVPNPDIGGRALVEGSFEARWSPLRNASDLFFFETRKLSFVLFYDAGNLWSDAVKIRISQVAMATGIGLRYETVAGPLRVDFGWKVYDPNALPAEQWVTQKSLFRKTLPDFVFHFGVGQAF